jgi:DNA-binding winged helix-turn-helix (wHTH) protein
MGEHLPGNGKSAANGHTVPIGIPVLARREDFQLGSATIRPSLRTVEGPLGSVTTEPRVMQVLVAFFDAGGVVLTREDLMRTCWSGMVVGDDALTRNVAELRRVARETGAGFGIETIPRVGYRLTGAASAPNKALPAPADGPVEETPHIPAAVNRTRRWIVGGALAATTAAGLVGVQRWMKPPADPRFEALIEEGQQALRAEWPGKGMQGVKQFSEAVQLQPRNAEAWGLLALAQAAETEFGVDGALRGSQEAARQALDLNDREPHARVAQAMVQRGLDPWHETERKLRDVLKDDPTHRWARLRMGGLLQSTGYSRESAVFSDSVVAADGKASRMSAGPLSRRAFRLWIDGQDDEAYRAAQHLSDNFRDHPLAWKAWLLVCAFTDRLPNVRELLEKDSAIEQLTPDGVKMWKAVLPALEKGAPNAHRTLAQEAISRFSLKAFTLSMHGVLLLSHLGLVEDAYELFDGMLLGKGPKVVSATAQDPQWRRTLWLFTPAMRNFRADREEFPRRAEQLGLEAFWNTRGIDPDEGRVYRPRPVIDPYQPTRS